MVLVYPNIKMTKEMYRLLLQEFKPEALHTLSEEQQILENVVEKEDKTIVSDMTTDKQPQESIIPNSETASML